MISELRFEAGFPDPVASKPKRAFSLFRRRNSDTGAEPEPEQRQPDTPGMKDPLLDKDEDGCTVLHLASMLHYDDCVAAILAAAAASPVPGTLAKLLEARDLSGNTALYYALNNEGIACVREFQKAGADFVGATIKHGGRWESAIEVLVYYAARAPAQNLACFKEVLEMLRVNPNFDINRTYDGRRSQRSSSAGDGDGVGDDQRPRGENPLFIPVNPMVGSEDEDGPFAYPMFGGDDDMVESDDGNPGNGRAHGNAQGADEDADSDVDEENDDDEDHIVDAEDMDAEELMEEAYRRMVMARFGDGRERKARSLLAVAASKGNIECVQVSELLAISSGL